MKVLVLGAGKMGQAIVFDLLKNKDITELLVGDINLDELDRFEKIFNDARLKTIQTDAANYYIALGLMNGVDMVISAVDYYYNYKLAKAAVEAGANFCDLGGNNTIVAEELTLNERAKQKGVTVIPDCGLAPGYVGILAVDGIKKLDVPKSVKMRVGGLPQNPKPPLNYKIVYSPLGLINSYVEPVLAVENGMLVTRKPLDDIEEVEFPEPFGKLEAFNTSGGTSTLPKTYGNLLLDLDYKTLRYKGHCERFKNFIDIGLCADKEYKFDSGRTSVKKFFAKVIEDQLSDDDKDCILVRVDVSGEKGGKEKTIRYEVIDYYDEENNITAMMRNTGYTTSIVAQMIMNGVISQKGAIPQEMCVPADILMEELTKRGIQIKVSNI